MNDLKRPPENGEDPNSHSAEDASGPPVEEAVGYRRPPKATRFKKGQSGNRRGRAKPGTVSDSSVVDLLQAELDRTLVVRDGGKTKPATILQVALLTLMRQAAEGDVGAVRMLFAELNRLGLMKPSSERRSGGVRRIPLPILTRAAFDAWFELMPGGRQWRQRPYREVRTYVALKQNAELTAREAGPAKESPAGVQKKSGAP